MERLWLRRAVLGCGSVCAIMAAACSDGRAQTQPQWKMAAPLPGRSGRSWQRPWTARSTSCRDLDNRPGVVTPTGYNWVYDPATNAWRDRKPMPVPAHHIMVATAERQDLRVRRFCPPTVRYRLATDRASWEYDPAKDSWKELAPMPTPRGAGQAVEVGGKIYVIGGAMSDKPNEPGRADPTGVPDQIVVGTVEEYDPATNQWRSRAAMPTARNHFFAGAVDGKIYAIDGRIGSVFVTKSDTIDLVEAYDPATDHWTLAGRAPTTRGDVTGDVHNGLLYVAGGEFQDFERKMTFWAVEVFDPATGAWTTLPHMQVARHGFAAAFVGNKLHVMGGGFQSDGMPDVDPTTSTHEVIDLGGEMMLKR